MKQMVLLGRVLYSSIFIMAGLGHFSPSTIAFATSQGVTFASVAVPLSGVMAILGGLSIALGYKAKYGAWILALFLLPVTVIMHQFWTIADPMMATIQQAMFMKNLAMLGGAFLVAFFGSGPLSLDSVLRTRQSFAMRRKEPVTV